MKHISGTFLDEITVDIPSQNWGPEEWRREFDTMKEAGIDTVIIIRPVYRDRCAYPSALLKKPKAPDLCRMFLDEAHRCGMQFFMGSYESGEFRKSVDEYWASLLALGPAVIRELNERYGDHPAFAGWYISPEPFGYHSGVSDVFRAYAGLMKELHPDKPTLISPGYPSLTFAGEPPADRHSKFVEGWDRLFTEAGDLIDICAMQDGSCSHQPDLDPLFELELFAREISEVCGRHNIRCWNNCETFSRGFPYKFPSIDWPLLKEKLEMVDPYVEKHITFEFSHFLSPNSTSESARNLYRRYRTEILGLPASGGPIRSGS